MCEGSEVRGEETLGVTLSLGGRGHPSVGLPWTVSDRMVLHLAHL